MNSLDCPFKISYIYDEKKEMYSFNSKKSHFTHNHKLDYKGLTNKDKEFVLDYMKQKELEGGLKPIELQEQAGAYLQGQKKDSSFSIQKSQSYYLQKKARSCIWGPDTNDATTLLNLTKHLRKEFPDALVKIQESEGKLKNMIFSTSNMKKLYSAFNDIILIDSTYRTNKYKLPLIVLAAINEEGRTFIIGFGVVQSEEAINISWILKELFDYFAFAPNIICSDSCPTLDKVIRELLPNTTHLLCGWHVAQNLRSHTVPLSNQSVFLVFTFIEKIFEEDFIKNISQLPYCPSKSLVEELFDKIKKENRLSEKTKSYFQAKFETKERWCLAYKCDLPCLKINTTLRIEGINGVIKTELSSSSSLVELLYRLLNIANHKLNLPYPIGSQINQFLLETIENNPIIKNAKEYLSSYAFGQFVGNFIKASGNNSRLYRGIYTVETAEGRSYSIKKESILQCNCKYFLTMGIVCSHILCIVFQYKNLFLSTLKQSCKARWFKEINSKSLDDSLIVEECKNFLVIYNKKGLFYFYQI